MRRPPTAAGRSSGASSRSSLVADTIAPVVQAAYSAPRAHGGLDLAVASLLFTFQIYFDFSAYSDIAVGLGKLLGFQLMRNFAYPYFAASLGEFWRRWHISLSTWFRDYVFIPLGGSRTTPARHAAAIMTTFLLSGLWHGAAWTFVVWGGLHGAALLPESLAERGRPKRHASDVPGGERALPSPAMAARMLGTFAVVCVGWVFFRAATLRDALFILRRIGATAIALSTRRPGHRAGAGAARAGAPGCRPRRPRTRVGAAPARASAGPLRDAEAAALGDVQPSSGSRSTSGRSVRARRSSTSSSEQPWSTSNRAPEMTPVSETGRGGMRRFLAEVAAFLALTHRHPAGRRARPARAGPAHRVRRVRARDRRRRDARACGSCWNPQFAMSRESRPRSASSAPTSCPGRSASS